jgi:hypothetical protein
MIGQLNSLRSNKRLVYAVAGALGGALGAVFAELVLNSDTSSSSRWRAIIETGLWSAAFASVLGATLFVATEWYQRQQLKPERAAQVLLMGALAGLISGAGAQFLYGMDIGSYELKTYGLRIAAWAIMGALLGTMLSRYVPNLGTGRGFGAGALGGAAGCIGFLLTSMFVPGISGRIVGIALLGLALGLAMYFVETMSSEASVEVEWAPYESTLVGLGAQPVVIGGGGEEHIFKKGLAPMVSSLIFKDGRIEHVETASGKRTPLQDGSRLRVGGLNMVIHATSGTSGPGTSGKRNWLVAGSTACAVLVGAVALTIAGPRADPNVVAGQDQATVRITDDRLRLPTVAAGAAPTRDMSFMEGCWRSDPFKHTPIHPPGVSEYCFDAEGLGRFTFRREEGSSSKSCSTEATGEFDGTVLLLRDGDTTCSDGTPWLQDRLNCTADADGVAVCRGESDNSGEIFRWSVNLHRQR